MTCFLVFSDLQPVKTRNKKILNSDMLQNAFSRILQKLFSHNHLSSSTCRKLTCDWWIGSHENSRRATMKRDFRLASSHNGYELLIFSHLLHRMCDDTNKKLLRYTLNQRESRFHRRNICLRIYFSMVKKYLSLKNDKIAPTCRGTHKTLSYEDAYALILKITILTSTWN